MGKNRMEAFSDGVYAIVITLLILELKVPVAAPAGLLAATLELLPELLAFVLSFVIIGMYWIAHHSMVDSFRKTDRNLLWLNLLNLLFICFIPFPTSMIGKYPSDQFSVILYALSLSLVNITGTLVWLYGSKLEENNVDLAVRRRVAVLHTVPVAIYLAAFVLSFFSITVVYILFATVPLFFIFIFPRKKIQNYLRSGGQPLPGSGT